MGLRFSICLPLLLALSTLASAQQKGTIPATAAVTPRSETRDQMLKRLGLAIDPGTDPDSSKMYLRYGHQYRIEKFEKRTSRPIAAQPGWVHPWPFVNATTEVYQENDKWVWVFIREQEKPRIPVDPEGNLITLIPYSRDQVKDVELLKTEMEELTPRAAGVTVHFEESSAGLPQEGSWRNGVAIADMNEDGKPDIIAPPQRSPVGNSPEIFLGDGKGGWKRWDIKWPSSFSYGNVAVGDLNKDGHLDLVFAVHLSGVIVMLGDGKGNFTESSAGLEEAFPTRKVVLLDINGDGKLDIVAESEGPRPRMQEKDQDDKSKLIGFINDGTAKSWKKVAIAEPARLLGGDWMATGDFNGDGKSDIVTSSNYFSSPDIFYMGGARGTWKPFGRGFLPFYSYYFSPVAGRFTSKKQEDVILTYARQWPRNIDPELVPWPKIRSIVGVERMSWSKGQPVRTPIARWASDRAVWGMNTADFDGDGNLDLVYALGGSRGLVLLLSDGNGHFRKSGLTGIEVPDNSLYDIAVADVNGDGKPDIIIPFEDSKQGQRNGSIHVYLNRGLSDPK